MSWHTYILILCNTSLKPTMSMDIEFVIEKEKHFYCVCNTVDFLTATNNWFLLPFSSSTLMYLLLSVKVTILI